MPHTATPDGKGGVNVIFNMNPAKPTEGWNQIMTLPRRLTLQGTDKIGRDTLLVEPAGDVESLRGEHRQITDLTLPANQEIVLGSIRGDAIELMVEIEANDAPLFELNVLRSPAKRSLPASPSIASAASATGSGTTAGSATSCRRHRQPHLYRLLLTPPSPRRPFAGARDRTGLPRKG